MSRRTLLSFALAVAALLFSACAPDPLTARDALAPLPLPPLAHAPTTRERVLAPVHEPAALFDNNPALPEYIDGYLAQELGALADAPGADIVVRTVDDAPAPTRGPQAHRLARIVHLADAQLMDDESPNRAATMDSTAVDAALRPQDPLLCRVLNAAVRTINALHAADPIDLVLLGGDNADAAQENEVRWVMDTLNGSDRIECDSGADDDLDPGADDGKDAFASAGLAVPWLWMNGNHDVNVQGNFAVDVSNAARAIGSETPLGTRVYADAGFGAVLTGDVVVADPARRLLTPRELADLVSGDGDGHGLARAYERATFAHDIPHSRVTIVAIDTSHARGGAAGVVTRADFERDVKPLLDDALARARVVLLGAHHSVQSLTVDGGFFGVAEDDALLGAEFLAELAPYPNIIGSLVAHSHQHGVTLEHAGERALWQVMTSALADFPHQLRVVEIWDDDNGTYRIDATPVDIATDDDPLAALGRTLGVIDWVSGWQPKDGRGALDAQAVSLIVPR